MKEKVGDFTDGTFRTADLKCWKGLLNQLRQKSFQLCSIPIETFRRKLTTTLIFEFQACLLQHRDHIIREQFDYQEIAMYFDRMVRKHDVEKTLAQARKMFAEYLNDDWSSEKPNC